MATGANGLGIGVGDRVSLTGKFLRNTGQMVGGEGQKKWVVQACGCGLCGTGRFVAEDEPATMVEGARHINAGNLFKRGTLVTDNCP